MNDHSRPAGAPPAVAVALTAGVCGAVQPKINGVLGTRVGSTLVASLVDFTAALAVVVIVLVVRPGTRRRLRQLRSWPVPPWTLTAGLGGALIVIAGALAVETIGVAIFSVAFFAGQIGFGVLVDRFGVAPGGRRPVAAARVQASAIAVAAVVVSQIGRPVGEFAPALVAFVVAAGAVLTFQSAFNGRIAAAPGDAFAATRSQRDGRDCRARRHLTAVAVAGHVDARTGRRSRGSTPAESWA